MKTINIVTPHYAPEITAAAHRMQAMVKTISEQYFVNVIALTERGKVAEQKHITISDRVQVHYIDLPLYNKANFITRARYEFVYAVKMAKMSRALNPDVIIATSPFMFVIPAVGIHGGQAKKIIDVRDLVWCYLPDKSFIQKIVKNFFTFIAEYYIKRYDHITVTNPIEKQHLKTIYPENKITIVSNGIDEDKFKILSTLNFKRTSGRFNITYIGNIGTAQNMISLINAAKEIPSVQVIMIGEGNDLDHLKSYVKVKSIVNVAFTGKLNWEELMPYYQSSDALYAKLEPNYSFAVPSKLYEYLSTGLPVIYSGVGEAVNLLRQFENVITVDPLDDHKLKEAILQISSQRSNISERNKNSVKEKYIRENINRGVFTIFNQL